MGAVSGWIENGSPSGGSSGGPGDASLRVGCPRCRAGDCPRFGDEADAESARWRTFATVANWIIVAIVVMFVGHRLLSVLTAAIASRFVKTERGSEYTEVMDSLGRIEAELAELRQQLAGDQSAGCVFRQRQSAKTRSLTRALLRRPTCAFPTTARHQEVRRPDQTLAIST
jgi:hypothetical protein